MNLLDAVSLVLKESDAPLHVSEITKRILSEKLWETSVEAPEETVGTRIYSEYKEKRRRISIHSPHVPNLRIKENEFFQQSCR